MTLKTKLWLGIVSLGVIGFGWYWFTRTDPSTGIVTESVRRTDVSETVSVSGQLVPQTYADLSFKTIGTVASVPAAVGESVKAGDVLATLDQSILRSQLASTLTALTIAEQNEKLARRKWDDLKPEERQVKKLLTEAAREDVRTFQAQADTSVLRAPFDGIMTRVDFRPGETVIAGEKGFRIVRNTDLQVEARVPESDIVKLSIGMEADITFDALDPTDIFRTKVVEIKPAATIVQDVVSYVVTFTLAESDARLKDGMSADIDIVTAKREGVLTVPFRALSVRGEKTFATVARPDGTSEDVQVRTGLEGDDGTVEILSGLKEGDTVIISAVSE